MDDSLAVPYDVLMNKVDVRIGHQNLYNFYKMQVGSFVNWVYQK